MNTEVRIITPPAQFVKSETAFSTTVTEKVIPKELLFKAETLAPVIADVKNNACELWLLMDEGIYLTAEKPSFVRGKRNISYAEGFDPYQSDDAVTFFNAIDEVVAGGDIWECVTLSPDMHDSVESGTADLVMQVTESGFVYAVKARDAEVNHAE